MKTDGRIREISFKRVTEKRQRQSQRVLQKSRCSLLGFLSNLFAVSSLGFLRSEVRNGVLHSTQYIRASMMSEEPHYRSYPSHIHLHISLSLSIPPFMPPCPVSWWHQQTPQKPLWLLTSKLPWMLIWCSSLHSKGGKGSVEFMIFLRSMVMKDKRGC